MDLLDFFRAAYARDPDGVWVAPGRATLMGHYNDYSHGFALTMALPQQIRCAAAGRDDDRLAVRSVQAPTEVIDVELSALEHPEERFSGWTGRVAGVVWSMLDAGHPIGGASLVLDSNDVLIGAGLSSTTAVACAVVRVLSDLFQLRLDRMELARLALRAENEFAFAQTGIVDHVASLFGKRDNLLLLEWVSLSIEPVPLNLAAHNLALLAINFFTPMEGLFTGWDDDRRRLCLAAEEHLGMKRLIDMGIERGGRLWELSVAEFEARLVGLGDGPFVWAPLARHVVSENARVKEVVARLRAGEDPRLLGPILTASHKSLRDEYGVSRPAAELAIEAALAAGAHGARMSGDAFSYWVMALVDASAVDQLSDVVGSAFDDHGLVRPYFFRATPSDGAHREGAMFESPFGP